MMKTLWFRALIALLSAGWLVPVEMEAGIIANREQYGVARRICRIVPMSSAATSIPRVTSDIEAYFVGEGSDGTPSDSAGDSSAWASSR